MADEKKIREITPQQVLDVPLDPDIEASTVRGYLVALLTALWRDKDGFSGKRPFGDSGWTYDLTGPLVAAGLVSGSFDEDGCLSECDDQAADDLIAAAITSLEAEGTETERLRSTCRTLATVTTALSRSLKAAYIELAQGHPDAAREWIANAVPGETWDGDEWDESESAQQWFNRTETADA